jgi:hypothetical protein
MKALLCAITACAALGTPALALADAPSPTTISVSAKGSTTLVCHAPAANEQQNSVVGDVGLVCINQSVAPAKQRLEQMGKPQQRDDQSWVYDIIMLDRGNGDNGGG